MSWSEIVAPWGSSLAILSHYATLVEFGMAVTTDSRLQRKYLAYQFRSKRVLNSRFIRNPINPLIFIQKLNSFHLR
jgi:hypothetical protein